MYQVYVIKNGHWSPIDSQPWGLLSSAYDFAIEMVGPWLIVDMDSGEICCAGAGCARFEIPVYEK